MLQLLLVAAVLGFEPTPAEQKLIDKSRKELTAARVKAGGPLRARIEQAEADLEAIKTGEVDPKLRQTFTRKMVRGKPVYTFRHETYREKELANAKDVIHNTLQTTDQACTPPLNLLALRTGAKGMFALTVNGLYTAAITENEADADGVNLLITVGSFDNSFRPVPVRVRIRGVAAVGDGVKMSCVVTGVKLVHNQPVYQLLVVEQFSSNGDVVKD